MQTYFQPNRPVYVKTPFNGGKAYKVDDLFPWENLKVPMDTVKTLFDNDFLKHSDELEETTEANQKVGDGLSELNIDQLHTLVDNINARLKSSVKHITEYNKKKVPTSRIKDKQIGLIRRWRLTYGNLE
jgi:hypothetical protein